VPPRQPGERSYMGAIETMQGWIHGDPVWPYARILETWGAQFEMYRLRWRREIADAMAGGDLTSRGNAAAYLRDSLAMWHLRDEWVIRFGFAIPCGELLDHLAAAAPIVEVGAGTGYMTALMRNRGIEVIGSDLDCRGYSDHGFLTGCFDEEQVQGVQAKTMVRRYPERAVFCSWPTLNATWFRQMLRAMRIGQQLVVIREDACAEETAWQYLNDCFDHVTDIDIPAFLHLNDIASVYIKKRQRPKV
jgi:hypothetical protein